MTEVLAIVVVIVGPAVAIFMLAMMINLYLQMREIKKLLLKITKCLYSEETDETGN